MTEPTDTAPPPTAPPHAAQAQATELLPGVLVGHDTDERRPTGVTVVLLPEGSTAGVAVRGAAPGTRETDLLDPTNTVQTVDAIVLSGGSAFGLAAADGVMGALEEAGRGVDTGVARVPIVPAAVLFDLFVGDPSVRPDAVAGRRAVTAAVPLLRAERGNVGAGAGATVGKLLGPEGAMRGGIGIASMSAAGVTMAAVVAVNAVGDVLDPSTGAVVAGSRPNPSSAEPGSGVDVLLARLAEGADSPAPDTGGGADAADALRTADAADRPGAADAADPLGAADATDAPRAASAADAADPSDATDAPRAASAADAIDATDSPRAASEADALRAPGAPDPQVGPATGTNTTIGVLVTDAELTKAQANRLASVAHDGLARTIRPAHTTLDGDTLFAAATGTSTVPTPDMLILSVLAAEVTALAVLDAVRSARGLRTDTFWLPAAADRS